MNQTKVKNQGGAVNLLVGSVFILIAVIMLLVSTFMYMAFSKFKSDATEITGTIEEIYTTKTTRNKRSSHMTVSYEIEGKQYSVTFSERDGNAKVGDPKKILVSNSDHSKAISPLGNMLAIIILASLSVIFLITSIFIIWSYVKKAQLARALRENGRRVYATVVGCKLDRSYAVNGRNPYLLVCEEQDDFSGETRQYISNYMWNDPSPYIGNQVTVFVDPASGKYIVDIETLVNGRS